MQPAFSNRRFGERTRRLRKSDTSVCRSEEGRIVVRDEWSRDDRLDRLVLRADFLRTAEEFRRALAEADQWEAKRRVTEYSSHLTLQP